MKERKEIIKEKYIFVEANKRYSWCSCGLSNKQPLCDGSHKETAGSLPIRMWFHKDQKIFISRDNGKLQLRIEEKE